MNFETFSTSSSFLHRLDARVKLVAGLALVVVIALCRTFPTACAGLILALVLVLAALLNLKSVGMRLLLVNGFVIFLWITLPLTYPGTTAFALGPVDISREATKKVAVSIDTSMMRSRSSFFNPIIVPTAVSDAPPISTGAERIPSDMCMG